MPLTHASPPACLASSAAGGLASAHRHAFSAAAAADSFVSWGCLDAGCEGIAAINTIASVMGINLTTLRPEPSVEGYSTPGGYSSKAVKPIALAKVYSCT